MSWLRRTVIWLALGAGLLAPIAVLGVYAFSQRWFYPALLPPEWTASTFVRQLTRPETGTALLNSSLIALLVSLLALLVGYPAARALELGQLPAKGLIYALLFVPTVVPTVATGIGLNILFLRLGLAGTRLGVALVHLVPVLPYAVFTLGGVFAAYDPTYEAQARVLGASRWMIWRRVTLPLLLPGLVVTALFAFLISWSQYVLTFLIGGGQLVTLPTLLFTTVPGGNQATTAALALVFVAPLFVVIALTARYLAGSRVRGGELLLQ